MAEDVDVGIDDMQEIVDDFLVEAEELVQSLDVNLVELESTPDNLDLLNEIFRAAHTIKGTSSFLGFEQVTSLTHHMEDILNKLRKGEMVATQGIMDLLLESLDILKTLLGNVKNKSSESVDLTSILAKLAAAFESKTVAESAQATKGTSANEPNAASSQAPANVEAKVPAKAAVDQTIRVDVQRLDTLMNMMGELVLGRNSLLQNINHLNAEHEGEYELERLNQAATAVSFITTELQAAVMKMRMQPVGKVFGKFPRLVRDLSRDSGKQIQLNMYGESTELDKSVIEEIGDPLVHIIRNSCDHGIESPDDRVAAGKPAAGTVELSARQEGSNIVIKIWDDGRGFDVDAIRDKTVEKGLVTRQEVDAMPDAEVYRYIFAAGLSTAKQVTGVSGRGVGMDVVRTNIENLSGAIELDSVKGQSTTITIKLPLTLAIIQGLLVEADGDTFILPLASVHETVKMAQSEIYYISQRPVLRLRDEIIPIINLGGILNGTATGFTMSEKPYIVIVGMADKKLGIMIDRFLGQEEVVIKSLGSYLGATDGVAGATIMGDGRIRLIIDLIGLFHLARKLI